MLRRYIGTTDEDISDTKCLARIYPPCDFLFSSPMRRCIQTASIIYPNREIKICPALRECDFGGFENKSFEDLKDSPDYREWFDSGGKLPFPGGETHADFKKRCVDGFYGALSGMKIGAAAFVIHGGSIMAVMQTLFGGNFYDYQTENGGGYIFELKGGRAYDYNAIGGAVHSVCS